ncbi:MAG: class I SAM-dependent methyltransferase [Chloroflexi bacterium]|nr:class I SAM-dependent methyltransferase [Chloroflexota bacterium]
MSTRQRKRSPAAHAPAYGEGGAPPHEGSWEHVASWYDSLAADRGTEFHQNIVIPGVLRLLGLQTQERVLDLACGQGAVTKALFHVGAQVTGVDLSPRLVEMARQRSPKAIRYLVGDARHLDILADESFDATVCVLAAQNIEPIAPVFAESARLLRRGGRLVMVMVHPAFRIPRQSAWKWDEERKLLLRAVDRYLSPLKIPIDVRPFRRPGQKVTWTYHRPLEAYVNGLAKEGLWLNALEEWPSHKASQPGPMARAEDRARAEFPLFLALRAVRVPQDWLGEEQSPAKSL